MKGFKIICKSEKGEEVLLKDMNVNKKVFLVVTNATKPFLVMTFLFNKKTINGRLVIMSSSKVSSDDFKRSITNKMKSLGAEEKKDYDFEVIDID